MQTKVLYMLGLMILVLGSVKLTKILMQRYKLNRWIIGGSAPLVLIIPSLVFKDINPTVWNLICIIFSIMCIMFFEITRDMLEKNKLKGMVKYTPKRK